ncbi:BspA family leucine-rich repeat surface protein [Winogradskyella sp. R77965]|uniref:BspA family leucine-rich repeat surface protein n=1 Tax=Winogradskyella sp. R77965 TaxID=3093872 RepID=UPI0037DC0E9E
MIRCLLAVLLTLSVSSLLATNIYVDQSAPAGGDGSSWANAFQDIQSAVDVAAADDTIFIAAGIYRPESEIDITVPLSIKGGYPQGGGAQDIDANTTQIQADFNPANLLFTIFDIKPNAQFYIEGTQFLQARRAITTYANISINNVQFNESSTADLWLSDDIDFCTVTNSTFTGCVGSSLYLFSYQVNNLLVDNCVFQNGTGRALFIHDEVLNTTFTNSIIRNYNSTTSIATLASPNTTINKLTIDNNSSSDVIQLEGANTQINNLTATNNSCTSRILFHFEGTAIITNSTFNNNLGTGECIQTTQNCYLTLENVDFIDNTITDSPIIRGNGEAFFANDCKFINNETSGTFSTIVDLRGDDGADIAFDNCEIKNNRSGYGSTFDISYDADVVINNCVFENNGQSGEGDLDFWTLKSAEITNNRFDSNTSTEPVIKIGFMMVDNALIRNNTFLNNTGSEVEADRIDDLTLSYNVYYGNSIFLDIDRVPIARLNNEYFEGNNTNSEFIRFDETTARINNMTMISTLPSGNHTLIESANDVALRILNSTISAKNYTDTNVRVDFDNDVPSWVRNSIIWSGNDLSQSAFSGSTTNLTVRNSLIKGEDPPGAGNLDGTQNSNRPRFSDPSDLDFRVRNCSPTINAGNNTYQNLTIDLLTNPRIFETTIDMGAYEFQDAYNASCETPERPLCTQLELPTDGSTNIALDTMLEWTGSPNAIGYILRVGTSLGASDILNTTLGNDTTYNLSEDLPPNTEIFVRIIPFNGTGNALSCVSESFTTASVPNCSSLISPSDGVIDVAVDSNITWSPSANATGYIIRIGDALGSFNLVNTVVGNITTYDLPSDLPEGTEIFVRVIPFNPIGNANSCLSESFTTETLISIPNCTTISMPLDGDTDVPITSDLSWNSVPSADNYSVTIGTTSGGTDIFDNISVGINTTVSLPNFPENTEIFVTIVPSNSEGDAIGCAEESFTTETLATIPNCTNLTSPLDGATGVFPVSGITWNPITNADGYLVTVTTTSGVNNFTNADVTTNTLDLISQAFTVGDLVTVLVIPYNSAGEAIGCTSESYTIIDEPACTNLIEPLNNALNVPVNTDLSWNADDEAIGYRLSIGTTSGGTDILDNFNTGNTTYNLPADLPESTEIFVTIIPYNVLFTASGCTQESFTTETLVNTNAFITTWKTDNAGVSNNDQITIPTFGTGYNYNVDWGDGNATTGETGNATHTYASIGTYTVSITGDFPRIRFNNGFDKDKILTIEQWGDNPWTTMENAFFGCTNLNITNPNIDEPNLTNLTELDRMFEDCTSFNGDVTNWDVSNVESLRSLFRGATIFNQDIGNWDVSNVQYLSRTFANALAFNQDISSWNVSNVTNMLLTFYNAESFNQPIQSWDVSNVTSFARIFEETDVFNQPIGIWDTSSATIISGMFNEAVAFNQDISNWDVSNATLFRNTFEGAILFNQDISSWDTSSATDMLFMFKDAIAFNQDISSWDVSQVFRMFAMFENATAFDQDLSAWNVQSLTTAERMFDGVTLSTANYDALLIGWNAQNLQPNVPFSGGDSQYCDGEVARTNMITGDGWMITDGGSASPNITALANQTHSNSYTLPVINGTNLTGSERYYTAPNGGGTIYSAGEIINFADFPSYPVILYIYDGSGLCASEESFTLTLTNDIIPSCTSLTTPLNGTTDVSIITDLTWTAIANADGYLVTVGTTSGDNDILDNENVTATTFDLPADLPENTEIFVTITPYNGVGNATGCAEESFITETLATIPNCTTLTTPLNGSTDISIITDLTWTAIANADGYLVTVGTTSGGNDILDNEDITATTFDLPTDLPEEHRHLCDDNSIQWRGQCHGLHRRKFYYRNFSYNSKLYDLNHTTKRKYRCFDHY